MDCEIPMAMEGIRTGAGAGCLAGALRDHQSMVFSIALHCLRDREFKRLVRDLEAQCHRSPMGTGFLGWLARLFSPHGVSGLRMAIFDDPEASRRLQAGDFDALVQGSVGGGMAPMIRVRSQARGERTVIYARPEGGKAEFLIVAADPREVVVVSLRVDPKTFQTWMEDPVHLGRHARHGERPEPGPGDKGRDTAPR